MGRPSRMPALVPMRILAAGNGCGGFGLSRATERETDIKFKENAMGLNISWLVIAIVLLYLFN